MIRCNVLLVIVMYVCVVRNDHLTYKVEFTNEEDSGNINSPLTQNGYYPNDNRVLPVSYKKYPQGKYKIYFI